MSVLLRGLRAEFSVTVGVIRVTEQTLQDSIVLLVIQETKNVDAYRSSAVKAEQTFPVKQSNRSRESYFCSKKGHIKANCFKNPKSTKYKGKRAVKIRMPEMATTLSSPSSRVS